MKNIKKQFISVLFVLLILCNFMFIPAYADDVSDVYALFTTDWGHSVLKNQYYQYLSQTDDDFYMNHMQNFNFDATYYQIQQFANRVERAGLNAVAPIGLQIVGDIVYDNLEIETGAKYKAALLDRELLLAMDNTIVQNIGQNGVRYTSLDDLGITTVSPINTTGISVVYHDQVCPFLGKNFSHSINSYYDLSVAQTITSAVSVYTGGAMPPAFYVPANCTVYQSGKVLLSGFYVILGTSELFGIHYNYSNPSCIYRGFGWTNSSDTVENAAIYHAFSCDTDLDGGLSRSSSAVYIWKNGEKESSSFFQKNSTNGRAWQYIKLLNNLSGFMIDVDETPTTTAPDTFLPDTVPYDDDGFVYVFIPVDNSDNVSYGDIIYMNPEDYDTYVNNGMIVEGDYINTYSYDTATSIIDSYNTYITNNNTTNNYNFDDTRIVNKLDQILQKLTEIKNKISNVSVTVESWDTPISTIKREYPDVFSNEPCYENFSDCVTLSLPVVADIQQMLEDLQSPGSKSADDELARFNTDTNSNTLPAPSGSGDTDSAIVQTSTSTTKSLFSNFSVDLSWYEPYRVRVRSILKIGVWVFGIVTYWQLIKSVFGIRLHNFAG